MLCSHCFWFMLRSTARHEAHVNVAVLRISPSLVADELHHVGHQSGDLRSTAAAAADTRAVSSSVPPGGSSTVELRAAEILGRQECLRE